MLSLAALLAAALCPPGAAQVPFRVDVNLVNVSFSVRDARGALVTDLGRDDFEIFEDGAPQKISFFARSVDVPLALGLVVDFSGSQERFIRQHHRDLASFLESVLAPRDRAFLVGFGNRVRLLSDFSGSAGALVEALKRYERREGLFADLGPREQRILGSAFYDAIYHSIAGRLAAAETGRRALLVFSDGEDNSSAFHMMDAIEAAQAAGVVIYGLRYTEVKDNRPNARNKYGARVMERMAQETGGRHFDAREAGLRKHFVEIGTELRSSYELAYHSTNPQRDGAFRKIAIRPGRPGLSVRAKTGYFAR